jgi:hypothetical protein
MKLNSNSIFHLDMARGHDRPLGHALPVAGHARRAVELTGVYHNLRRRWAVV